MEALLRSVLFRAGLCRVDTPQMVARYKDALGTFGLPHTGLNSFHIDGLGWSPEIAVERGDRGYLSSGAANSVAIILTPAQRGRPACWPLNSYDRPAVQAFFEKFPAEIADITTTSAVALDIDRELSFYKTPKDLLLVDYIVLRPELGGHIEAASKQKLLVDRLMNEESAWRDRSLRAAVMQSASEHGDLRYRRVAIPDMRFGDLQSFYSKAFGGVFVVRRTPDLEEDALIVLESSQVASRFSGILGLQREMVLARLKAFDLASVTTRPSAELIQRIEEYREELESHPEIRAAMPTVRDGPGIPSAEHFQEVEVALKRLSRGQRLEVQYLSASLAELLTVASPKLGDVERSVVEMLLARVCNRSARDLYRYDTESFLSVYEKVPLREQEWLSTVLVRDSGSGTKGNEV